MARPISISRPDHDRAGDAAPASRAPLTATGEAAERSRRKQRLAAGFRLFAQLGFDSGVAGHMTVRDPERTDAFWVNPLGVYFGHLRASDLVLVDHAGAMVEGDRPINQAAFAIHSRLHAERADVQAAVHAHSPAGQAWSALGRPLDPITQDACAFFEDHAVFGEFSGVVDSTEEGQRIATCLGARKAVILQNHGLLTVGRTVDEALWWYLSLERACQVQLAAEAAGTPRRIPDEVARRTQRLLGSPMVGWASFQPLWARLVAQAPELAE